MMNNTKKITVVIIAVIMLLSTCVAEDRTQTAQSTLNLDQSSLFFNFYISCLMYDVDAKMPSANNTINTDNIGYYRVDSDGDIYITWMDWRDITGELFISLSYEVDMLAFKDSVDMFAALSALFLNVFDISINLSQSTMMAINACNSVGTKQHWKGYSYVVEAVDGEKLAFTITVN